MTGIFQTIGRKVPGSFVVAAAILVSTIILSSTAAQSDNRADMAVHNASSLGLTVTQLCDGSKGPEVATLLHQTKNNDGTPVCDQAGAALRDPVAAPVVTAVNYPDARMVSLIRAELAKLPPPASSAPSFEQVTAAVRNVMSTDPLVFKGVKGDPAPPVNQADLANAVAEYFRVNKDQFRGPAGEAGRDGPPGPTVTVTRTPVPVTETVTETHDAPVGNGSPPNQDPAPPQEETPVEPTATPNNNTRQRQRGGGLGGLLGH